MKKFFAFLTVTFCALASQAQIVEIPDPVFKAKLLEQYPNVDSNDDGEIQVTEAQAVTSLDFYHCNFENTIGLEAFTNLESLSFGDYCGIATPVDLSALTHLKSLSITKSGLPPVDLSGLSELEVISVGYSSPTFVNLTAAVSLNRMYYYSSSNIGALDLSQCTNLETFSAVSSNGATSINLEGLVNLRKFALTGQNSALTSLDLSDLVNLRQFSLGRSSVSQLDFSNTPLLESLSCYASELTSLDLSNLPLLKSLSCSSNHLTSLDVSNNVNLETLGASDNLLHEIDLTNLHKLYRIYLSNNLFTTIDLSGQTGETPDYAMYDLRQNPNLVSVNLKNGRKDYITANQPFDCPNLVYLCLDEADIQDQQYVLANNWITDIEINTYCNFIPGGAYNTITGVLSLHPDGCSNATAYPMRNTKVNLNDGTNVGIAFTDGNGRYNFYTQDGNFTLMPEIADATFSINPQNTAVTFTDNQNHIETRDFCVSTTTTIENLDISLIPRNAARPGFDAQYELVYRNTGNQIMTGSVALTFDDAVLDLVTASPTPNTQTIGVLNWEYTNLLPFERRSIYLTVNVNSPMETPPVNLGDILHFDASISPIIAGVDNHFALDQIVVGSFDPNDKTCLEGNTMTPEQVGKYLHYLIRFQNSGTAAAENIVVKDMIDTEKFDVNSLELVSSSHPHQTRVFGNKVEFIFEGINLPAESDDEPASHGYVAFKIKTKDHLVVGNDVSNIADIYFDYNFPITTEPAITTVALLAKDTFEDQNVLVSPNPVQNKLHISAKDNITSVSLFDMQGRLIRTAATNDLTVSFDMSGHATGVYFVKIQTKKGVKTQKIIKE